MTTKQTIKGGITMKIIESYIVKYYGQWHLLNYCGNHHGEDVYFITSTGAFGQRDMTIIPISREEALALIDAKTTTS